MKLWFLIDQHFLLLDSSSYLIRDIGKFLLVSYLGLTDEGLFLVLAIGFSKYAIIQGKEDYGCSFDVEFTSVFVVIGLRALLNNLI